MRASRSSIAPPHAATQRYQEGWRRGDAFAVGGGDLHADGPGRADEETWCGYVDALAAHRDRAQRG